MGRRDTKRGTSGNNCKARQRPDGEELIRFDRSVDLVTKAMGKPSGRRLPGLVSNRAASSNFCFKKITLAQVGSVASLKFQYPPGQTYSQRF